eukprot:TRINITY_DN11330_c0_g1_i4.p1 TRINITY_DN11330_c0_g1~~TRINITY_DN11330_c0_g1_i4.p1  ORF type:complete len:121 (+),score=13.57 TRINITY_DN11330_c0_g1_i4:103-465(+)
MKNTTSIVLGAIINAALACKSDLDCSLNGECMNDSCRYFSAWGGSDCGVLQFKPSLQPAAYSYDPNVTSWDGNILALQLSGAQPAELRIRPQPMCLYLCLRLCLCSCVNLHMSASMRVRV